MVLQAAVIAHTSLDLAVPSLLTRAGLAALPGPAAASLALHAAHGAWLALFLGVRDGCLATYAPKKAAIDARAARLGPGARAGMWVGVAGLYVCLAVPAWAVATAVSPGGAGLGGPASRVTTAAGLGLAAAGLWLEVTADIVKAVDKARQPAGFSHKCVYRLCRQPNLLGEAAFWWGLAGAAGPALWAARAALPALATVAGLAAITAILVGDSEGKAANQARRMRGRPGWAAYAGSTPALWPLPRRGGGGGGGGSGGRAATAPSVVAAAATPRRTTPRRAAATPRKRVG